MGKLNKNPVFIVIRDGVIISMLCAAVAITVNAVRPDGIDLITKQEYEIFVPCPEPIGEVESMSPVDFLNLTEEKVFLIDARIKKEYGAWHYPGAQNIPFDYLMPVCTVSLKEIASSGARMVIVYGDGKDPDSGRELGRELSGNGIKNVHFVEGGAPLIRDRKSRMNTP
jgi:hypothetical protein